MIIFDLLDFEIILGMTWLSLYYVLLNCNAKTVTLVMHGMDKLEKEGVNKAKLVKIISFVHAKKIAWKQCSTFPAHLWDVSHGSSSMEYVTIISEF